MCSYKTFQFDRCLKCHMYWDSKTTLIFTIFCLNEFLIVHNFPSLTQFCSSSFTIFYFIYFGYLANGSYDSHLDNQNKSLQIEIGSYQIKNHNCFIYRSRNNVCTFSQCCIERLMNGYKKKKQDSLSRIRASMENKPLVKYCWGYTTFIAINEDK